MKKLKKIFAMILSLGILATVIDVPVTARAAGDDLKFDDSGKFKIVIFSDVQDQFPVHQRVINIMDQAIDREKPDLVVFLGDNTEQNIKDPEVDFRRTLNQILAPVVNANVPYAFVFGNHDDQSYYSGQRTDKDAMLAVYQSIGDCRTTDPDPSIYGTGTCKIPIYASAGGSVAFNIFMIDSNAYQVPTDTHSGYGSPHADQLQWLVANNDAGVNSIAFQHIPMPEYYDLLVEDANGTKTYNGKKYAKQLNDKATGYLGEFPNPCQPEHNTGEFDTLKSMGVLGLFTGHDHLNDYVGTLDGMNLTAVPGMTYFNYGNESVRGYGVIELNESDLTTYDYHSVKFSTLDAEAGGTTATTYDVYDEIGYEDLRKDGQPLPATDYNIHGSNTFTFDGTSPSHSAIFRFRWTAGADTGIQFSFDEGENGNCAYPFGVWVKKPNQGSAGSNGAWHLKPNISSLLVNMDTAVKQGDTFDIELGRLKILTGDPVHLGEYYVYLKVNGILVQEGYSNTSEDGEFMSGNALCQVSNTLRFGDWSSADNNNRISAYVEPAEQYEPFDEITYDKLLDSGGHHLAADGTTLTAQNNLFTYNATSPTHSAIYRFTYTAGETVYFQMFPGAYRSGDPFAYRIKDAATYEKRYAPGAATKAVGHTIADGEEIEIEVARLMVSNGTNAGKYYTYFKANGETVFEAYVPADLITGTDLDDAIQFNLNGSNSCKISETWVDPDPDALYYPYDEIGYYDLRENGNALGEETQLGSKNFTYNKTSQTGSVILKYRWRPGQDTTQFHLSFDKADTMNHMFGVQFYKPGNGPDDTVYPTNSVRLRPGKNGDAGWVALASNIVANREYDVEFARLKVKNGENAGKYYVYFKLDGQLISESYVEADVVDADGNYTQGSTPMTISNVIYLTFWGGGGIDRILAVPEPETYYDYDTVNYSDLRIDGNSLPGSGIDLGSTRRCTYTASSDTYSAILKFRFTAGDDNHTVIFYDAWGGSAYPFCLAIKRPNYGSLGAAAGENGAWHVDPSAGSHIVQMDEPLESGKSYDIEFARLKVKTGPNKDNYYVYLKVDGELIYGYYYTGVSADGTYKNGEGTLSNNILFTSGNSGLSISETPGSDPVDPPEPESIYEPYDVVTYNDLLQNGNPLSASRMPLNGNPRFGYNCTSPTYSVIFQYRWTAGSYDAGKPYYVFYFDKWSGNAYPFSLAVKSPNYSGLGAAAGEYGAWHLDPSKNDHIVQMTEPIVAGQDYDIEHARLKVATGPNAGKYHVYVKVNGELIYEYYYEGANGDGTYGSGDKIQEFDPTYLRFTDGTSDSYISATPVPVTYEDYDEIGYADLIKNGQPVPAEGTGLVGGSTLEYASTSPTGSVLFKYNWTVGSVAKVQLSFEKTSDSAMEYLFGAWLSEPGAEAGFDNGRMWLRPSYGPQAQMPTQLAPGSSHNVEYARLKVKTGSNAGKYHVYIKIDDVMIAEDYVAGSLVDASGNYTSNPGSVTCNVKSGQIFFAFWGSEGNAISAYKDVAVNPHEGTRGDLNSDGELNLADVMVLRKILAGSVDLGTMPEGIADFNIDGATDLIDIIAMKKYLYFAATGSFARTGSLTLGMQEHLLEDATKTSAYIADATGTMGADAYRLSYPIHQLYYANGSNSPVVKADNMAAFKAHVADLKAQGVDDILYVTDAFILPYGYSDAEHNHNITVPDPKTDPDNYSAWLKVNSEAFGALAAEVPEIGFFEPFNEINLTTTRFEKYGVAWSATDEQHAAYKFTVDEKAGIMADLCWYVTAAVRAADRANQVTTPSIAVQSNAIVESSFLDVFYKAIESGNYPSGKTLGDVCIDNFFTIVNVHAYPEFNSNVSQLQTKVNNYAANIGAARTVMTQHGDGGSSIWLTETGVSSFNPDGVARNESTAATLMGLALDKISTDLTYVETVIMYKIADISSDKGASPVESGYGLFYSGDDLDHDPYAAKPIAKTVYSFFNGGTTDYSALTALEGRYN